MSSGISLVRKSTAPLGDFQMPICISLIASGSVLLSDEDIDVILSRYKEHVKFWNISEKLVATELGNFAAVAGKPLLRVFARYREMDRGFWRQYLEPASESQILPQTTQHYVTMADRTYLLDIQEQRNRTVVRVRLYPGGDMTQRDLANINSLSGCMAKRFQVWVHSPDVVEEYARIFVSFTREERRGRTGALGVGIPVPIPELIECIDRCLAGSKSP